MISWGDLWTAVALMLVVEGIFPFINPGALRRAVSMIEQLTDGQLRMLGVLSMSTGVVLLYFVRG